jgi:hypothetical protein
VLNVALELHVGSKGQVSSVTAPALVAATGKTYSSYEVAKDLHKNKWTADVESKIKKLESAKNALKEYKKSLKAEYRRNNEDQVSITISNHNKAIGEATKGVKNI